MNYFYSERMIESIAAILKACPVDFVQIRLFQILERVAKYNTTYPKELCSMMLDVGIVGHMERVLQRHTSKNDPLIGAVRECFTVIQLQYLEQVTKCDLL